MLYTRKGCNACHSIDGSPGIAPTFKGLYGSTVRLADDSTATADFAYIRESILDPGARIVAGYPNQMPLIPMRSEEVLFFGAYLATLSDHPPEANLRDAPDPATVAHQAYVATWLPGSYAGPHGPADPPPSSLLLTATAALAALFFVGGFALATGRRRA